jgi:hypothetical protein
MPAERVLIEVATVFGAAGINEAKAGFLGLTSSVLGAGLVLAALVVVGKSMIEISNAQVAAEGNLTSAINARNRAGQTTVVQSAALHAEIASFIKTNAGFISNLADVTTGYASLVREGVPAKDLTRDMNIAVNIAAAESISLSDAVGMLQSAEAGRNVGLKKMVGITLEAVPAHATLAEKEAILERNTLKVQAAFAGATAAIPPMTQNSNKLSVIWQELADKDGPSLTKGITDMENSILAGLPTWLSWLDTIGRVSDALQNWSNQSSKSTHNAIVGGVGGFFNRLGTSAMDLANQTGLASGGPASAGGAYTVGERGPELLQMGSQGGSIIPNGGGRPSVINIHIDGGIFTDGPSIDRLANLIAQRVRYASGT